MKQVTNGLNGTEQRNYYPRDIDTFGKNYGLSSREISDIFCLVGKSKTKYLREIEGDQQPLPPTLQMLLRMYLRYPETIPFPHRLSAQEFFENDLGGTEALALRFRGVLFGVDKNSGYNWNKDSVPTSQVVAIMAAAKKIKAARYLSSTELLQTLLDNFNTTTEVLKVNPMKKGGWKSKQKVEDHLKLSISDVADKAVKSRGRRVIAAKKAEARLTTFSQSDFLRFARNTELTTSPST